MNPLHLLWIVPLALWNGGVFGFILAAVCAAAKELEAKAEEDTDDEDTDDEDDIGTW